MPERSFSRGFSCHQLSKAFATRAGPVQALLDASFSVPGAQFVCLVGPSGCGKSTLLRVIAGLLSPSAGQITFHGNGGAAPTRAMVFQEQGLFPWMNVLDNIAFGLEAAGVGRRERHQRADAFIHKVGLAGFAHSYPYQLSGGMRQRVAVARAFLTDPEILLMDEPFGALDAQTRLVLQEELLRMWQEQRQTVVYVTHDIEEAILLGDRILVMSGRPGQIRQDIRVPLSRPRDLMARDQPEVAELYRHIWDMLAEDVRRDLRISL